MRKRKGSSTAALENDIFTTHLLSHINIFLLISAVPLLHDQAITSSLFLVLAITSFSREITVKLLMFQNDPQCHFQVHLSCYQKNNNNKKKKVATGIKE